MAHQNNAAKGSAENAISIYQIRLDLKGVRPPIWRRLLLPATLTLDALHDVIQVAMGWSDSHLHAFQYEGMEISDPSMFDEPWGPFGQEMVNEAEVVLSQFLRKVGDKLQYEYDFGDGWEHVLKLEKILPEDPDMTYPVCVTGRRACPPDDVGGIWGYQHFLDALADETHPEHEEYSEWIGEDFDPEAFDPEEITAELQDLFEPDIPPFHGLTILRWQMLSPEVADVMLSGVPASVVDVPPDHEQQLRQLRKARSARTVLDVMPVYDLLLMGEWMHRLIAYGPKAAPLIAERMAEAAAPDEPSAGWIQERLALVLHRIGPRSVPALLEVFDKLGDYGQALACITLGQLGAAGSADLVWDMFNRAMEDAETGLFLGPLWALIDLNDSRATDAVLRALEEDWAFTELIGMASRVGDRRVVIPLLAWIMVEGPTTKLPLQDALAVVGHRIGRQAVVEEIRRTMRPEDDEEANPEDLVDLILGMPVEVAEVPFRTMFNPMTIEDIMAEFAEWDDGDDDFLDDDDWFDDDEDDEDDDLDEASSLFLSDAHPSVSSFSRQTPFKSTTRPGRNDPCWCGSGKKYKDCHWREDLQRDIPQAA